MIPSPILARSLLAQAQDFQKLGLGGKAFRLYSRLARSRTLTPELVRRTHLGMAHLLAQRRKFRRARKHLAMVLAAAPLDAGLHYRMARLCDADLECEPNRTKRHFRQALHLDPANPRILSGYGLFANRNGKNKSALKHLRRAFRLAPYDRTVLNRYVTVLRRLGRVSELKWLLRRSRFRLARQEWFGNLLSDSQFFLIQRKQKQGALRIREYTEEVTATILPFARVFGSAASGSNIDFVRDDRPVVLRGPHLPLQFSRQDQRHAQ